jgi:thiol:disulfide interchange protein DsbD
VEIGFSADWLMCEAVCIPGGFTGTLKIPVKNEPAPPSADWASLFSKADAAIPLNSHPYAIKAWQDGQNLVLRIQGESLPETAYFFDELGIILPDPSEVSIIPGPGVMDSRLRTSPDLALPPTRLTGVLYAAEGWPGAGGKTGLSVETELTSPPTKETLPSEPSWTGILLLAFIGGMILNLMPCVFPVLGIKIMGFVNQAGESRAKVVAHGLTFTAGVLISFWILASVLLLLRSSGSQLGWGFQLQSPGFVLALTMILFAFGLNMSGLFEIGQSAVGVGSNLTGKSGLSGSFFSGVLATVVATPCAAPFLAPALGAALALPPLASIAVFSFIALGLSSPYLILSMFPSMIRWLPKPGAWMETFKHIMGFLLYATVAYLIWVLAGQLTDEGGYGVFALLKVLLSLVILALALWVYGRWGAFHKPAKTRLKAVGAAGLLGALAFISGLSGTTKLQENGLSLQWDMWEPGKPEALAAEGRIVYVDFTARWCVTCQTNKATVFSSKNVRQRLAQLDAVLLKADWTHQDPRISEELGRYGRSAVPFNLVYGPGLQQPRVLPEILTPGIVLEALTAAEGP